MKREFLEGFGLNKEAVDKIMSANGDDIQNARQSEAQKFATERESLNQKITDLTAQGEQRDTDLKAVKEQLTAAQTDAGKLADVQKSLTDLHGKYDSERKEWENRDKQQRYEFAVKTAAAGLKFSSDAAKNYFVSQAIGAGLKMSDKVRRVFDDVRRKYDVKFFVDNDRKSANAVLTYIFRNINVDQLFVLNAFNF